MRLAPLLLAASTRALRLTRRGVIAAPAAVAAPALAFDGQGSSAYAGRTPQSKLELRKSYQERVAADVRDFRNLGAAIKAGELLHVGNSFSKDFAGATAFGAHAVLLDRFGRDGGDDDLSPEGKRWRDRGAPVLCDLLDVLEHRGDGRRWEGLWRGREVVLDDALVPRGAEGLAARGQGPQHGTLQAATASAQHTPERRARLHRVPQHMHQTVPAGARTREAQERRDEA